jgi:tetratricopeptide (TPR) repeat protein
MLLPHVLMLATALTLCAWSPFVAAAQTPPGGVLTEARQAYDATEYERAQTLLDSVIAGLGNNPTTPEQRQALVAALELRGRTLVNLQNLDAARQDFRRLLLLNPSYLLSEDVGPRVAPIFDEVRKQTVGTVAIVVSPADAQVTLDENRIGADVKSLNLTGGSHMLSAARQGYKPASKQFNVLPGEDSQPITLELERISSNVSVVTSPADVTVIVNGVARGVTALDPEAKGPNGSLMSKPLVITDLPNGRYNLRFERVCFQATERQFDVPNPGDYRVDTVTVSPAVATVNITGSTPGATVFVDDAPRGPAPMLLENICEGEHTIEVRTAFGRHVRRYKLATGQKEVFQPNLRPAFALISDSGAAVKIGDADYRRTAESAFEQSRTVTLFAPEKAAAESALKAENLPVDWLAYDILRKPLGQAASIAEQARGTFAANIARKFGAQGVAAVAREPGSDPSAMLLILLAAGSTEPDVFRWRLDNPDSYRDVVRALDRSPALFRASLGVLAIDVVDVEGVVVAAVDRGSVAEAAGIQTGDTIVAADGSPVRGVAELMISLRSRPDGGKLSLDVRDRAGATKKVDVAIQSVPNIVSIADQDLPANKLLLEYAYRTSTLGSPLDEAAVRLNVAALSLRLKNRAGALAELKRVLDLALDGAAQAALVDSIRGTAQYLSGVAASETGDTPAADAAWRQAAKSQGVFLVEDSNESVKDLAEQRLGQSPPVRSGIGP